MGQPSWLLEGYNGYISVSNRVTIIIMYWHWSRFQRQIVFYGCVIEMSVHDNDSKGMCCMCPCIMFGLEFSQAYFIIFWSANSCTLRFNKGQIKVAARPPPLSLSGRNTTHVGICDMLKQWVQCDTTRVTPGIQMGIGKWSLYWDDYGNCERGRRRRGLNI